MGVFNIFDRESRSLSLENPAVSLIDPRAWSQLFGGGASNFTEEAVNEQTALAVPAIRAAISTIAGDISALPAHVYRETDTGREKADGDPVYRLFRSSVNDDLTKVNFIKWVVSRMHIDGRALVYIEKNKAGRVANLHPFYDIAGRLKVSRVNGKKIYTYGSPGQEKSYRSDEVLDFVLNPSSDGLGAISPIHEHRNTIGQIVAASRYAATMFDSGGVPLTIATMPPAPAEQMDQAAANIQKTIRSIRQDRRPVMAVPTGVEFKQLGSDPTKTQMIEARMFLVREVCRVFSIPPILLRDLADATFSNAEQQELVYTKHTLVPLIENIEAEINAKLFGRTSPNFLEFDLTRVLRGDLASTSMAYSQLINSGVMKPGEVRAILNLSPDPDADHLVIQGAMVRLESLGEPPEETHPGKTPPSSTNASREEVSRLGKD